MKKRNVKRRRKNSKNKNVLLLRMTLIIVAIIILFTIFVNPTIIHNIQKNNNRILAAPESNGQVVETVNVDMTNYSSNTPGSWKLSESAKWTSLNTAMETIEVNTIKKEKELTNNYDIILALDVSGSMQGDKLSKAQSDAKELIDNMLDDPRNKVALITYSSDATIKTGFTNDKNQLFSLIDSLSARGTTNYNDPLMKVDSIMQNYTKVEDRDVITVFLTDGLPNIDTPNEVTTYNMLKSKYPYMDINGIQYEMGEYIQSALRMITDNQWAANKASLNNVLFQASLSQILYKKYEKFEIQNLVNNEFFTIKSLEDINVNSGYVSLEEENGTQKIVWTFNDRETGFEAKMDINLTLKDEYIYVNGFYPTGLRTNVDYKIEKENEIKNQTTETPILERKSYSVIYYPNGPEGKNVNGNPETKKYFPYEKVTKEQIEPTCDGWNFKNWYCVTDGLELVNEDVFVMPFKDVELKATWGKPNISKSMDGTIATQTSNLPQIGDTVYYSPSGTYSWDYKYASTTGNDITELSSAEGGSFRITEWRVLSTDPSTGNIEIVPAKATNKDRKVYLNGSQGYNNLVYLLNSACYSLYANPSKGITARSISEVDFEKAGKRENVTDTDTENAFTRARAETYNDSNIKYGEQAIYYVQNDYYPSLYEDEIYSVINDVTKTTGLKRSEQPNLVERTDKDASNGSKKGKLQSYNYAYNLYQWYNYLDNQKAAVLRASGENTKYILATRYADSYGDNNWDAIANFGIMTIDSYSVSGLRLQYSSYEGTVSTTGYVGGMFPVVTLNSNILEKTSTDGVYQVN